NHFLRLGLLALDNSKCLLIGADTFTDDGDIAAVLQNQNHKNEERNGKRRSDGSKKRHLGSLAPERLRGQIDGNVKFHAAYCSKSPSKPAFSEDALPRREESRGSQDT